MYWIWYYICPFSCRKNFPLSFSFGLIKNFINNTVIIIEYKIVNCMSAIQIMSTIAAVLLPYWLQLYILYHHYVKQFLKILFIPRRRKKGQDFVHNSWSSPNPIIRKYVRFFYIQNWLIIDWIHDFNITFD